MKLMLTSRRAALSLGTGKAPSRPYSTTMASSKPTGLIANKGIELLTWGTPNGHKASIICEELKEAYGMDYTFQGINIGQNVQKEPWYTKLNPNGRIPTIVDHDKGGFAVMEGAAILTYLTRNYDPEKKFTFRDPFEFSTCEQWIAWQTGAIGPMQGQAGVFLRNPKEKISYGIQRYVGECERLYGILNARLADRDYIAGSGRGKYSIADISCFGWANMTPMQGLELKDFPNVLAWLERIAARPAVQKGISVPTEPRMTYHSHQQKMKDDPEYKSKHEEIMEVLKKAKQEYGYVYKSP